MANIRVQQGATTVDGSGPTSTLQTGLVTGASGLALLVGASHAGYAWFLARPADSGAELSSDTAAVVGFAPDEPGDWLLVLQGKDASGNVEATYSLPLSIQQVETTKFTGPVAPAHVAPAQVAKPSVGATIFSNSQITNDLEAKLPDGTHLPIPLVRQGTTGQRPGAALLYLGFQYYDTTLTKPIWWNGSAWKDATGGAV
jgi:hypothetical protein